MCYTKSKKKLILKFRLAFLTAVTSAYSATTSVMIITQLSVCRIGINALPVNRTSAATVEGKKWCTTQFRLLFPPLTRLQMKLIPPTMQNSFSAVLFQFLLCQQNVSVL